MSTRCFWFLLTVYFLGESSLFGGQHVPLWPCKSSWKSQSFSQNETFFLKSMIKVNIFGETFHAWLINTVWTGVCFTCLIMDKTFLFEDNRVVASLQDGARWVSLSSIHTFVQAPPTLERLMKRLNFEPIGYCRNDKVCLLRWGHNRYCGFRLALSWISPSWGSQPSHQRTLSHVVRNWSSLPHSAPTC